jgi:hypothetical protein
LDNFFLARALPLPITPHPLRQILKPKKGAEKVVHPASISSHYQPTAVKKTTFFLVLVEGATVAPNWDPNLLAS